MKNLFLLLSVVFLFVSSRTSAVTVSGTNTVCTGLTTTFTADAGGGTWSSATPAVATVDETTGVITGVSTGTSVISYNLLGIAYTRTVTVQLQPGAITGTASVCQGLQTTLANSMAGTWASSNTSVATINGGGVVNGIAVAGGTATITFRPTASPACFTTREVTVNPLPTTITGLVDLCHLETITVSSTPAGGTWTSTVPATASIDPISGLITATSSNASLSVSTITYTLPTGCIRQGVARVNGKPAPIGGGVLSLCDGGTSILTSSTVGQTWSSTNPGVATITSGGLVSAVTAGTTTISYTNASGCASTVIVTVNAVFTPNTGTATICQGLTSTLSNATAGGSWTSSNLAVGTVVAATGVVRGIALGTTNITYTISTSGCLSVTEVTVVATPAAIGGTASACIGNSSTLTHATSGGAWSSSNAAIGTVNSTSGAVTGITAGTATISYTVFSGCFVTRAFTVNALPVVNAITGTSSVCISSSTSLSSSTVGGVWSSSVPAVATVGTSGSVSGLSAGNTTISYTVTNGSGCVNRATREVTVNALPVVNAITGTTNFCQGTTTLLSSTTPSGVWSSSTIGVATVGTSGLVNGVAAGTSTISYTVTDANSCVGRVTTIVTVNAFPTVAAITGTRTLCANTTTTLASATSGGVWSSSATGVATVGTGGVVSGVSDGNATISYVVTNVAGCSTTVTAIVTVNVVPTVDVITGTLIACVGATTSLANTTGSGVWSSSAIGVATIGTSGIVSGVSGGNTTISYTVTNGFGCIGRSTAVVTINALPVVAAITGTASVCLNGTTTLSNATASGVWSSSAPATASIDAGGVVSGLLAGNATISYTLTNAFGCVGRSTVIVSVNPLPVVAAITGTAIVCETATTNLANATASGVWSSSAAGVATVGTSGIVTGVNAGNATISYTVTNGFGCSTTATVVVTVNPRPTVAAITGTLSVCDDATTTLSNITASGVWSSSAPAIATVGTSGIVTGVSAGNATISYTVTNGFGCSINATAILTVNPLPVVAAITGTATVCQNLTTNLSNATAGGVWSSSDLAVATVGTSGTVTGVSAGNAVVSYTVTNGFSCTTTVTTNVTVNPAPVVAAITGTQSVCVGATTTLANVTGSGVWSSSAVGVATVGTSGIVTGVSAGNATITYTVTNGSGCIGISSAVVTVNALPTVAAITGTLSTCVDGTTTLSNVTGSGVWSSSAPATASISVSGVVTGILAGNATISYTVTNGFGCVGRSTAIVTVNALPVVAAITGTATVCVNGTTNLANATSSGVWSSSAVGVATVGTSGIVSGVSAGNATISYTVTNGFGCTASSTISVTVNPLPTVAAITGTLSVCEGVTTTLSNATAGGVWSSLTPAVATIDAGGLMTGVAAGNTIIRYRVTNGFGCIADATATATVNVLPSVAAITGTLSVCQGLTTALSSVTSGGVWTSSATGVATVGTSGVVTGVASGNATISYTVTIGFGCATTVTAAVTVNPLPTVAAITGTRTVCVGLTTALFDATADGVWSSSATGVATIGTSGIVTGVAAGNSTISYTVTTAFGCLGRATAIVTVNAIPVISSGSGFMRVCNSSTVSLTSSIPGGTWVSSSTANATIGSASGLVTGVSAGNTNITYTVTATGCVSSTTLTVDPIPTVTGIQYLCIGNPTLLTGTPSGGAWSSSNTGVATVNSSGLVTSVSIGTSNITYTGGAGCFNVLQVTVNGAMPAILGNQSICQTNTTLLTNAVAGGTWTSSNVTIATVGSSTGLVTGVNTGVATISYSLNAGCFATIAVTVMTLPVATTGPSVVCVGSTVNFINTVGTWTSSAPAIASVNNSGLVTGLSVGGATITFYPTGSICYVTKSITVGALPTTIGATTPLCPGQTASLSASPAGGTWSIFNPDVATINPSTGLLTAVMVHPTNLLVTYVYYTLPTGCSSSGIVTVKPQPAPIFGTSLFMCSGESNLLITGSSGGTWSSTNPSVATIATGGTVTSVGVGTSVISYTNSSACASTVIVTVNSSVSTISGQTLICTGQTSTFTNAVLGGTWTISNPIVASINNFTGVVSGISAGTANVSYTIGTGCVAVTQVTVNSNVASIIGTNTTCVGSSTTLSYPVSGGTWSVANTSIATVDSVTGLVSGIAVGGTTVTYTISSGCFKVASFSVAAPLSPISGTPVTCEGSSVALTATGGTWSSSNTGIATISASGVLTGVSAGNATISYSNLVAGCYVTIIATVNARPSAITSLPICSGSTVTFATTPTGGTWSSSNTTSLNVNSTSGSAVAFNVSNATPALVTLTYTGTNTCATSAFVTINPQPSAFSSGISNLCIGGTTTYISTPAGGIWSSDNTSVATAATGGFVTATGAGVAIISYTNSYGCTRSSVITVNGVVSDNTGIASVCTGQTTALANSVSGGTWSSSNTAIATINISTGLVSGINTGTSNITYRLSAACFSVTQVTVNSNVALIGGTKTTCVGTSTNLTYPIAGGTWSSQNTAIATVDNTTGVVTGVATGSTTITYFMSPSCFKTTGVIVYAVPSAISGLSEVCAGATIALTNTGGTWSSANTSIATVNSSGIVTGVNAGVATINYRNSVSACIVSRAITVNAVPAVITSSPLCPGSTTTLITTPTGGSWTSANPSVASINLSTGELTALATPLTSSIATITYTAPSGCRRTHFVTVNPIASTITGNLRICVEGTTLLNSSTTGGTWSSSNPSVATISSTRVVTGLASGNTVISYTNSFGCSRTVEVTVNPIPEANTGILSVCVGTSTLLGNSAPGGTWSSSATTRASVGLTSGLVFGASAGTANITYNPGGPLAAKCISISQVTVNASPASITGTTNVCPGLTSTLSHPVTGGTWSSANTSIAVVSASAGVVTGINTGTTSITYALPNGCVRTTSFTVKTAPVDITGLSAVCVGGTISQFCFSGAGTWSSSNTSIATIGLTSGLLTGVSEGAVTITYRVNSTSCFTTRSIVIGATDAGAISGPSAMAVGGTATMSKTVAGGIWSASPSTVVSVGSTSGVVTAIAVGSAVVTYVITSSCSSDTVYHYLEVFPAAGALSFDGDNDVVLIGAPIITGSSYTKEGWVYTNNILGSSNIISSMNSKFWLDRGILKAGNAGDDEVVSDTTEIEPNTWVHLAVSYHAPTSTMRLYKNGTLVATSTSAPSYSSETTYLATYKDGLELLRGSMDEVRIWNRALCESEIQNNMNCQLALPQTGLRAYYRFNQGIMAGVNTGLTALTDVSGNGFVGTLINFQLTGDSSNWVAGAVSGTCAPLSSSVAILYTGTDTAATVAVGSVLSLAASVPGGSWSSSNSSVASVGSTGVVYGVNVGSAVITYNVSNPCISGLATRLVNVTGGVSRPSDVQTVTATNNAGFVLYPNPTEGSIYFVSDVPGTVTVYSVDGKQVANYEVVTGKTSVTLPTSIARGVYTCRFVSAAGDSKIVRLIYK